MRQIVISLVVVLLASFSQAALARPIPEMFYSAQSGYQLHYPIYFGEIGSESVTERTLILELKPSKVAAADRPAHRVTEVKVYLTNGSSVVAAPTYHVATWSVDSFKFIDTSRVRSQLLWTSANADAKRKLDITITGQQFQQEVESMIKGRFVEMAQLLSRDPVEQVAYPKFFSDKLVTRQTLLAFYKTPEGLQLMKDAMSDDVLSTAELFRPGFAEFYFGFNGEMFFTSRAHQIEFLTERGREALRVPVHPVNAPAVANYIDDRPTHQGRPVGAPLPAPVVSPLPSRSFFDDTPTAGGRPLQQSTAHSSDRRQVFPRPGSAPSADPSSDPKLACGPLVDRVRHGSLHIKP